ncbi:MAG: YybH family protein [Ferruginibacter sp.]
MKKLFVLGLLPCLLLACKEKKETINIIELKNEMMETDRSFSKLSETKGMRAAYMEYIDSNGVLLRPHTFPLSGADAIDYISQGNDSSYTMTWEPRGATIAKSGDLGYTYGIYSIRPKDSDTTHFGTYLSIWKRQTNGGWKFVLDTGNEGIGE